MARKAQDVTEAELAILEKIWAAGPLSVKELAVDLYGEATTSSTATVQKLLGRLEAKGCVDRDPTVWPRLFRPAIDRDELIHRRLQNTADDLCEGSLGPLLSHLIKRTGLSRSERTKLRSMLDHLEDKK